MARPKGSEWDVIHELYRKVRKLNEVIPDLPGFSLTFVSSPYFTDRTWFSAILNRGGQPMKFSKQNPLSMRDLMAVIDQMIWAKKVITDIPEHVNFTIRRVKRTGKFEWLV